MERFNRETEKTPFSGLIFLFKRWVLRITGFLCTVLKAYPNIPFHSTVGGWWRYMPCHIFFPSIFPFSFFLLSRHPISDGWINISSNWPSSGRSGFCNVKPSSIHPSTHTYVRGTDHCPSLANLHQLTPHLRRVSNAADSCGLCSPLTDHFHILRH